MVSAIDSALAGLSIFKKKMDVSANNIANSSTEEFKKSRVVTTQDEQGNPVANVEKVNTPGVPLPEIAGSGPRESSNVDLANEILDTLNAKRRYLVPVGFDGIAVVVAPINKHLGRRRAGGNQFTVENSRTGPGHVGSATVIGDTRQGPSLNGSILGERTIGGDIQVGGPYPVGRPG